MRIRQIRSKRWIWNKGPLMRSWFLTAILVVALELTLGFGDANGQGPYSPYAPRGALPNTAPVYSPYLNLLRGGSFLNNYYGLVRPEIAFRSSILGLQQQTAQIPDVYAAAVAASGLPTTGHATRFLNTTHYFLSAGGQQPAQQPLQRRAAALPTQAQQAPTRGAPPVSR
jgi:hypothetical protein